MPFIPVGGGGGGATTLIALTDTPSDYGVSGQVLSTTGGSTLWSTPSGTYSPSPMDWVTATGVKGAGNSTSLAAASFYDLADVDAGQSLASGPAEVGSSGLRIEAVTNQANFAGIFIGTAANATDAASMVRTAPFLRGAAPNTSINSTWGLYLFKGSDTSTGDYIACGFGRIGDQANTLTLWRRANTAGGRGTAPAFGFTTVNDYAGPRLGTMVDIGFVRDAATGTVEFMIGQGGTMQSLFSETSWHTGEITAALCIHSGTAGATVGADIHNIAAPGDFTTLPRVL